MTKITSAHTGQILEQEFMIECIKRGIILTQPTAATKYDFLLDNGNTFVKLQLKSARPRPYRDNGYSVNTHQNNVPYKSKDVDFFVSKIENEWYFVPQKVVGKRRTVTITPSKSGGAYSVFKNNWNSILGVSGSSAQSGPSQTSPKQTKVSVKYQKSQPLSSRQSKSRYQSR